MCGYSEILKNLNSTYSSLCWNWNELIYAGTAIYIVWGEIKKSWWKIRLKSIFNQIIDFNLIFRQHFFYMGVAWNDLDCLFLFDYSSVHVRAVDPINSSSNGGISSIRSSAKSCPADVRWTSQNPLSQPLLPVYSRDNANRTFQFESYTNPPRSEDSAEQDSAFCYYSRHFPHLIQYRRIIFIWTENFSSKIWNYQFVICWFIHKKSKECICEENFTKQRMVSISEAFMKTCTIFDRFEKSARKLRSSSSEVLISPLYLMKIVRHR